LSSRLWAEGARLRPSLLRKWVLQALQGDAVPGPQNRTRPAASAKGASQLDQLMRRCLQPANAAGSQNRTPRKPT
jgi:hypothetical protein